jgi:hypothetical protein
MLMRLFSNIRTVREDPFQNLGAALSFIGAQQVPGILIGRYCGERLAVRIEEKVDIRLSSDNSDDGALRM